MLDSDASRRSRNVIDSNVHEKIRVMLIDDTGILLWDTLSFLQDIPEIEIVGEVCQAKDALAQAQLCAPDIVLLDATIHGADHAGIIPELHAFDPALPVIMLDMIASASVQGAASAVGAAVVLKPVARMNLLPTIRDAVQGARSRFR